MWALPEPPAAFTCLKLSTSSTKSLELPTPGPDRWTLAPLGPVEKKTLVVMRTIDILEPFHDNCYAYAREPFVEALSWEWEPYCGSHVMGWVGGGGAQPKR